MRKGDGAADDKGVMLKTSHYQRPESASYNNRLSGNSTVSPLDSSNQARRLG